MKTNNIKERISWQEQNRINHIASSSIYKDWYDKLSSITNSDFSHLVPNKPFESYIKTWFNDQDVYLERAPKELFLEDQDLSLGVQDAIQLSTDMLGRKLTQEEKQLIIDYDKSYHNYFENIIVKLCNNQKLKKHLRS